MTLSHPYHTITPLGRLSMVDTSAVGKVCQCQKGGRWEHLAKSFPNTYGSAIGTLWIVDQSSLENRSKGV